MRKSCQAPVGWRTQTVALSMMHAFLLGGEPLLDIFWILSMVGRRSKRLHTESIPKHGDDVNASRGLRGSQQTGAVGIRLCIDPGPTPLLVQDSG